MAKPGARAGLARALDELERAERNYEEPELATKAAAGAAAAAVRLMRQRPNDSKAQQAGLEALVLATSVPSRVDAHAARHSNNRTRVVSLDVASLERLPRPTDLVFSRQMTQHLCNADVAAFLSAVNRSDAKLALLTTFDVGPGFENTDIGCASGGYRAQSLTAPPFSLPPPLRFFSEEYPTDPRVGLGLWKIPLFA